MRFDSTWILDAIDSPGRDPMASTTRRVHDVTGAEPERLAWLIHAWVSTHPRADTEDPAFAAGFERFALGRLRPELKPPDVERHEPASALEERFDQEMLDIYRKAGEASGYWAHYFLRDVRAHGGAYVAHKLIWARGTSTGFERLKAERRLDISMEALILRPEFRELFSQEERDIAEERLLANGYDPRTGKTS